MGRSTLLVAALLLGCTQPPQVDDPSPPPPPREESAELEFLTPSGDADNPVTLAVAAPEEVATVRYLSGLVSSLGETEDRESDFALTLSFTILGDRVVEAWGFAADGTFVGDGSVSLTVRPDPSDPNDFGLWIDPDLVDLPAEDLALRLQGLGVSRAYIKVAEGAQDCASSPALCDVDLTGALRAAGVQPWAWMVPTLDESLPQADMLFEAIPAGYQGLVLHVDSRWDGLDTELSLLGLDFNIVRGQCDTTSEHLQGEFPLYASLPEDPASVPVQAIDPRVDGLLVRVEGSEVQDAVCALRDAGAVRPIFPLLQAGVGDAAMRAAGRHASLWQAPDADDVEAWAALADLDWGLSDFEPRDCP